MFLPMENTISYSLSYIECKTKFQNWTAYQYNHSNNQTYHWLYKTYSSINQLKVGFPTQINKEKDQRTWSKMNNHKRSSFEFEVK